MKNHKGKESVTRRKFLKTTAKTAAAMTVAASVPSVLTGCGGRGCRSNTEGPCDRVIQNGLVYDGSDAAPSKADIGIRGDRIVAVGQVDATGAEIIDAAGRIVTPGFVDVHTHCDLTFQRTGWKRYLAYVLKSWKGNYNYMYQGVSTVVTGNCGYGYTDLETWYGIADAVGFGTNVAHLAPHGTIREELFGIETQPGALTAAQLDKLKARVTEEMRKGAFGMSTGLEYAPGCHAETAELIELAKVVRHHGGLYTSHIRDESGTIAENGKPAVIHSLLEAIAMARATGISVEISHLKITAPINDVPAAWLLDTIEEARAQGLEVHADQYPYDAGSTQLTILLPNEMTTGTGIREEFKTAEGRNEIRRAIEKVFAYAGPEKTLITMYTGREEYEGKTISDIAELEGRPAAESFVDMVCEDNVPVAVFFFQDMDVVKALMPHDYILTASDGWTIPMGMSKPHPRVYGTFPRKLRRFVLEDKLMDLPLAIRSMTSLPAEKFRIEGRGRIREGYYADIAVIDIDALADRATYADPHQYAVGVDCLLVNGEMSIEGGTATGRRGGRTLRRT